MPTIVGNSERREGSMRLRSAQGRLVYEFDYTYLVLADSKFQERYEILLTNGLPIPQVHFKDSAVCQSSDAQRDSINPLLWHVTDRKSTRLNSSH